MTIAITGVGSVVAHDRTPDWFDPVEHLGRRGWKYLSPATRYLLAAANQALGRRHDDPPPAEPPAERLGVATGTQYANADVHRRMNHTLRTTGVRGISPAEVPALSMNTPGSQLAITLRARAFCVTLTNPGTAGLEAVLFATLALRTGRADRVVATATEQVPDGLGHDGAAAVVLSSGPGGIARIAGGLSRFVARADGGGFDPIGLAACTQRITALAAGTSGAGIVIGAPAGATDLAEALRGSLAGLGAPSRLTRARNCTVSGLVDLINLARHGEPALVVAVSENGHVAGIALTGPATAKSDG